MLTFAILTTMTIMVQQKVFGTGIFGSADDGISMNNAKEKVNEAGKHVEKELQNAGDAVTGLTKFSVPIPVPIPTPSGVPLPGTLHLDGNILDIKNTKVTLTIAGFEPKSMKLGSDYTINTSFEATIEDTARDLSGGVIQIDNGKEMVSDTFGIQIEDLAKLKMNLKIGIPIPKTIDDIAQIENLKYANPSSWTSIESIEGCYNRLSNNLPDVEDVSDLDSTSEQGSEVEGIINDPNKAINQEEICTQIYPTNH